MNFDKTTIILQRLISHKSQNPIKHYLSRSEDGLRHRLMVYFILLNERYMKWVNNIRLRTLELANSHDLNK